MLSGQPLRLDGMLSRLQVTIPANILGLQRRADVTVLAVARFRIRVRGRYSTSHRRAASFVPSLVQLVINTYSISGRESRCLGHDLGHGFGGPVEWMGVLIPFLDELVDLCT